jgi:hypothetical protein
VKNTPRFAEKVAALSALTLLGVLFLVDWFGDASGWDALGWFALALCVLSIVAGLAVAIVFALYESPVLPQFIAVCALFVGSLTVIALLVQVVFQPGTDELVTVKAGWWLGLLAAAGVARGGFLSMRDEYLADQPTADVPVRPAPVA